MGLLYPGAWQDCHVAAKSECDIQCQYRCSLAWQECNIQVMSGHCVTQPMNNPQYPTIHVVVIIYSPRLPYENTACPFLCLVH